MSWFSKLCVVLAPVVASHAVAARVQFHGADLRAQLSVQPIASNAAVAPVQINLSVPGIEISAAGDGFDAVTVKGLDAIDVAGSPELFGTGSLIVVPAGYEPRLVIQSEEVKEVNGVVVRPSQKKFRCATNHIEFQFNSALYGSKAVFPQVSAKLEEVGYLQSARLVRVALNPLRQDMGNRRLLVTTKLSARVEFDQVGRTAPTVLPRTLAQLVRNAAANGTEIVAQRGAEKMLVVVGDSLKADIAPFVAWKRSKGLEVDVVTLTEAGGTKEKVKEYTQKYYDTATVKPTYFFFVGNKTTMPAFMESTSAGAAASDFRYATLVGTDSIPDVLYGRIIADNSAEVARQVNRSVQYEKNAQKGANWYSEAFTIASSEGSGPSDAEYAEQVRGHPKGGTYTAFDVFLQGDSSAKPEAILASLPKGRTWIAYFGHGSGTAWASTNGYFTNTHVDQVKNADKLPIIIDVACLNSSWVNLPRPFGKAWVTHTNDGKEAGAVAFYGGSVSISWHPPAVMSVGVAKHHFEKPSYTVGGSVAGGQLYLVEKMGTGSDVTDNIKWYNLFGDPSLLVRTAIPKEYRVKHDVLVSERGVTVKVSAVDEAGQGVKDLLASVGKGANPLAVGATDASGEATLEVGGVGQLEPGTVLTTSGYNAETHETVLQ